MYDVKPKLNRGVFKALLDMDVFMNHCGIMNDTLGWDVSGTGDLSTCIDIAPETLYALEHVANEKMLVECAEDNAILCDHLEIHNHQYIPLSMIMPSHTDKHSLSVCRKEKTESPKKRKN